MNDRKRNRKCIKFLLLLTVFSFTVIKISNKINSQLEQSVNEVETENAYLSCSYTGVEEQIIENDTSSEANIIMLSEDSVIDVTGLIDDSQVVLASVDERCSINNTVDSDITACNDGGGELIYGFASTNADQNVLLKLTYVTYPLAFWLGSYTYTDSNKEVEKNGINYRSNGEQIAEENQTKTLSPSEAKDLRDEAKGYIRTDFKITNFVLDASPDADKSQTIGEFGIHNIGNAKCNCVDDVSVSDYNVGATNVLAYDSENGGYDRQQIPGGDNYNNNEGEKSCIQEEYEEITKGFGVACGINLSRVNGEYTTKFDYDLWLDCTYCKEVVNGKCPGGHDETLCKEFEKSGTEIPLIFGDPYKCDEEGETCANAFLTYIYKGGLTPKEAEDKKVSSTNSDTSLTFFVATPCRAAAYKGEGGQPIGEEFDMLCLWDASPTLLNYQLEKESKIPNQDDFPWTFEEYWKYVESSIEKSAEYYYNSYGVLLESPI